MTEQTPPIPALLANFQEEITKRNGRVVSEINNDDGTTTFRMRLDPHIIHDLSQVKGAWVVELWIVNADGSMAEKAFFDEHLVNYKMHKINNEYVFRSYDWQPKEIFRDSFPKKNQK